MTERKKLWLVTLTMETEAYIVADTEDEARDIAKDDARDLFDGLIPEADSDVWAREVAKSESREEIWNDDRTVRDYLSGTPSREEVRAEMESRRPPKSNPSTYAEWLAIDPSNGTNGAIVYCGHAMLEVEGGSMPDRPRAGCGTVDAAAAMARSVGTRERTLVERGAEVQNGGTLCRAYGPALLDARLVDRWVLDDARAMVAGPLEAVLFVGDGWRSIVMPMRDCR